jgi:hypothetical protein
MATQQRERRKGGSGASRNGGDDEVARYEEELAGYLQERIKPGLNSGAIPLLARSIAKDIAHREHPNGASKQDDGASEDAGADDEPKAEADAAADDDARAEAEDESGAEDEAGRADADDDESGADETTVFEAEMHQLQGELGEDWVLRFSVQGDDAWLTAEKDDGSQRVEAPTAAVLFQAVELLNSRGGRSA